MLKIAKQFVYAHNPAQTSLPRRHKLTEFLFRTKKATANRQSLVRIKGLEPPRLSAPDPKSGVATNYTISALVRVQR